MRITIVGLLALGLFATTADAAVIVPFSGTGTLTSPNDGTNAPLYSAIITDTQGNAQISYTLTVTTNDSLNVSADVASSARGFGKMGQSNNALNYQGAETLLSSFSTVNAVGLNGWSVTSNDVSVRFDSFDLVNNGNNPPTIQWDIPGDGWQSHANTGGSGGHAETVDVSGESGSTLTTQAVASWMWINDIQTSYTGTVTLVPEPTTFALAAVGLLAWRRKRTPLG